MIGDLQTGRDAIFDALAARAALVAEIGGADNPRIAQEVAEQGASFPLVLIQALPSPDDSRTASNDRIFANSLFRVVGCLDQRNLAGLTTIASEIDAALHNQSYVISGHRVLSATRLRPYQRSYEQDGIAYSMSGGDYELLIQ